MSARFTPTEVRALKKSRVLARIYRPAIEDGYVEGRLVEGSSKLLVFALLDEAVRAAGFCVLRRDDVTAWQVPAPYAAFYERALVQRGESWPKLGRIDLSSFRTVVAHAARRFPLLTLHFERKSPDLCCIGRPLRMTARTATFLTIGPDALWDHDDLLTIAWADITRVDFGGAYEEALALVAAARDAAAQDAAKT